LNVALTALQHFGINLRLMDALTHFNLDQPNRLCAWAIGETASKMGGTGGMSWRTPRQNYPVCVKRDAPGQDGPN
jgi:hypothetical protein